MLFGKGKKQDDVPTDDVQKMSSQGMSDKDIIKKLKSEGYSYDSIEKAMLSAVKEGVEPREAPAQPSDISAFPEPGGVPKQNQGEALFPEFEPQQMPEMETVNPEIIVEELIEGVIEDKWNKFSKRLEKQQNELNLIRAELKRVPRDFQKTDTKQLEAKVAEAVERFDELEARVGGLEKAFKQFLPSLTRNIESLSRMIHEMKEKQGGFHEEVVR